MMHSFLSNNRSELIGRCNDKRAHRTGPSAEILRNATPIFVERLIEAMYTDEMGATGTSTEATEFGSPGRWWPSGDATVASGGDPIRPDCTIEQVVHAYGDLCTAVTELAFERDAPFAVADFCRLDRCVDNAIADAVCELSAIDARCVPRAPWLC